MRLPLLQPLQTNKCVSDHYITIGYTEQVAHSAGLWDAESILYLIGDAASRRGLCTGRVFHPAQRPVERAPA